MSQEQRFFASNTQNQSEDELLANLNSFYLDDSDDELLSNIKNFYLDDSDDEIVNKAYDNYLISISNYLENDHRYTNQVSEN